MAAKQSKVSKTWIAATIQEAATAVAVSDRTIRSWLAKGAPGRPKRYVIPELIEWARENIWKARSVSADPMLTEGDSPALERYREAKASQEEIKLHLMRKDAVPLEEARVLFDLIADEYRRLGEKMEKLFGHQAPAMIEECLDNVTRHVQQRWGVNSPATNEDSTSTQY